MIGCLEDENSPSSELSLLTNMPSDNQEREEIVVVHRTDLQLYSTSSQSIEVLVCGNEDRKGKRVIQRQ